jgi:hypothetical protein
MPEEISGRQAIDLLMTWGKQLKVNTKTEIFTEVVRELMPVVQAGLLDFNAGSGNFIYRLISPVEFLFGTEVKTLAIHKIEAPGFKNKQVTHHIVELACNITAETVIQLEENDFNVIALVIYGFFIKPVRRSRHGIIEYIKTAIQFGILIILILYLLC